LSEITNALQVYMGSVYVNDFDFNNRAYRVYIQAEGKFRNTAKDIGEYYVRSDTRKMIPWTIWCAGANGNAASDQPFQLSARGN